MAGILNVKEGANLVVNIINAIANGYREDMILDELAQAIENKQITKEKFTAAIEGLELYAARFANSVKTIANAMQQFEFNETLPILKNRQLNLAQQVMQDIEGFDSAAKEYDSQTDQDADDKVEVPEEKAAEEQVPAKKTSFKNYLISKLKEFKVSSPKELTDEQWDAIDAGWEK